ncbi:hypothetical protein chiPu_0019211 [Chiloscyllium punctatum]|uniref:Uncharacterized protein n=1 Tax=Chiloscyllium punctatum TaxID=137246 RepID=A0A401RR47_CHIPU|nr:hypothetical protein [Chiloscyllium punctatum]
MRLSRLKLRSVFVVYFLVSVLGLMYALLQLGQCDRRRRPSSGVGGEVGDSSGKLEKGRKGRSVRPQ